MTDWLSWIFGGLPFMHVCRVVDCFLVEGHKFFIRTAISIVYIWSKMQKVRNYTIFYFAFNLDWSIRWFEREIAGRENQRHQGRTHAHRAAHRGISNLAITLIFEIHKKIQISTDTFILTAIKIRNLRSSTIARFQAQFEEKVGKFCKTKQKYESKNLSLVTKRAI